MKPDQSDLLKAAILFYLSENPDSGDTLEGIARFWTTHQQVDRLVDEVESAIKELAAQGFVIVRLLQGPGGESARRYYQVNPVRLQEIKALVKRGPRD